MSPGVSHGMRRLISGQVNKYTAYITMGAGTVELGNSPWTMLSISCCIIAQDAWSFFSLQYFSLAQTSLVR